MTWREFTLYNEAYDRKELNDLVKLRQLMFTMVRMWGDPQKSPSTPAALWPLPTDPLPEKISQEDILKAIQKFSKNPALA